MTTVAAVLVGVFIVIFILVMLSKLFDDLQK